MVVDEREVKDVNIEVTKKVQVNFKTVEDEVTNQFAFINISLPRYELVMIKLTSRKLSLALVGQ